MKRRMIALLVAVLALSLILGACTPAATPAPAPTKPPATAVPAATEPPAPAKVSQRLPGKLEGISWDDVLAAADGQEVNWWMWGGSEVINDWVKGTVAPRLKELYNITLNQVPVATPQEFINTVLGEKEAGKHDGGAVDIMWINAENFKTMKRGDLLYGPFAQQIPSAQYVTWDERVTFDAGFPTDGYEMPLWNCFAVFGYDSAKAQFPQIVPLDYLFAWITENPGRFSYPVASEFVGSMFVRHVCHATTGGYEQYMAPFDQAVFDEKFPACWEKLNEIEPYLWREGETYPESNSAAYGLLGSGDTWVQPATCQGGFQAGIGSGLYPETTRSFALENSSEAAANYMAIAYNSAHLAASVVAANWFESPEGQYNAAIAHKQFPTIDMALLPAEWAEKFAAVDYGPAILPIDVLQANGVPMIVSDWWVPTEEGWVANVLQK